MFSVVTTVAVVVVGWAVTILVVVVGVPDTVYHTDANEYSGDKTHTAQEDYDSAHNDGYNCTSG